GRQGAKRDIGVGNLPGAQRTRHSPSPAPVCPDSHMADPPELGCSGCPSQEGKNAVPATLARASRVRARRLAGRTRDAFAQEDPTTKLATQTPTCVRPISDRLVGGMKKSLSLSNYNYSN